VALQSVVVYTVCVTIDCPVQPASVSATRAGLATLESGATFAYSDVTEDDNFDATRLPTASDKAQLQSAIFLGNGYIALFVKLKRFISRVYVKNKTPNSCRSNDTSVSY